MKTRVLLLFSLMAGCSGTDSTGPDGDDELPETPVCAEGEVAVAARLDGLAVTDRADFDYYEFNQISSPSFFRIDHAPVELVLDWSGIVAYGGSTAARGWFRGTTFDVGNCSTPPRSGQLVIDADGRGGRFLLRELHRNPYCTGAAAAGALAGCYRLPAQSATDGILRASAWRSADRPSD